MVKQMKEANRKERGEDQGVTGVHPEILRQRIQVQAGNLQKESTEKIELDDIRPSSRKYPYIDFRPAREIGNEVLTVENLTKTIDGVKVIDHISFILNREDKVALVGLNE